MTTENSSEMKNAGCCENRSCPFSEEELRQYAEKVQKRIDENDCEVFLNRSEWHAAIILRKFIESAKNSISIFCGHLNKNVYGDLLPDFKAAAKRGVAVRVLTASSEVCAESVADGLREISAFQTLRDEDDEIPHFAVVDGIRYRLETNEDDKSAVVCAFTDTRDQITRAVLLSMLFDALWEKSFA